MAADECAESARNELLRRVDWRFLLTLERIPRTFSRVSGRLRRGVELVSSHITDGRLLSESADLAVLVAPGRASLREAWRALVPGGQCYVEWRWSPRLRLSRVEARLEAAGFIDVHTYWPWPPPRRGRTQFWLPLDAPDAIAYFLATRRAGTARRVRVAIWQIAARLGLLAPICTVARKPGGAQPAAATQILLTVGRRSINKVVALVFDGSESTPAGVVKCARSASDEEGLRREAATLQLIERTRPELGGVPQFSSFGRRCGRLTLTESAVAGTPMLSTLDAVSFAPYAVRVTDRLAELAGTAMPTPRDAWWSRLVEEPLLALERTFEAVLYQEELKRARAVLSSLGDMPLVVEHRDCAPWNILVADRGALAFIDWESSEPSGLPGLDLVYFLAQAALLVEGHFELDVQASYARSLDPATPTGAVARRCEAAYAKRVGFDDELWPALRLLCWTVHAQSDWRHLSLEAAGEPDRAALHSSGFLMLWRTVMDQTPAVLGQMS